MTLNVSCRRLSAATIVLSLLCRVLHVNHTCIMLTHSCQNTAEIDFRNRVGMQHKNWETIIFLCRPVPSVHSTTSVLHNASTLAGDQSQPIVISDTPSPAVSIITIHSDSEDENDRKVPAAWWAMPHLPLVKSWVTFIFPTWTLEVILYILLLAALEQARGPMW